MIRLSIQYSRCDSPTESTFQEFSSRPKTLNPSKLRMRPPYNSFRPQSHYQRPQQQQNNGYSNHHQHNGYQNQVNSYQFGMMNPQMMNNPMMGHMNNPIPMPNMPIHPQFYNNMPQQQQQLNQFGFPNSNINHLLPNLLGNLQFAVANNNLMGHVVQPSFCRPPLEPSFNPHCYPPAPNHQLQRPLRPQGQTGGIVNNNTNGFNSNGNNFRNNFTKHQKFNGPGQGFQRSQSYQANNAKIKSGFNKDNMHKGSCNKMATELDGTDAGNIALKKKRSYALLYTQKEIKQWHEARRKNHPYAKKNAKIKNSKYKEAKLRRQQLREVLAKQAELGVEVAEVPSHYLSNGKGRYGDRDNFNKKPRFEDNDSITRKPTLLEKLLSPEIKREKSQLLQVFRFMVMNSFFKEFPENLLELPLVIVEETGCEHDREDSVNEILSDDDDGDRDVDSNGDDNPCDEAVENLCM